MIHHTPPHNEDVRRSAVLDTIGILDTLPEDRFDRYTRLTRRLLNVPVARVNLTSENVLTTTHSNERPVIDDPSVRFYAGCPLNSPDGYRLGTLSVMDSKPRALKDSDMDALRDIAAIVSNELSALRMATLDELTGLSNRRAFNMIADQCLRMCIRDKRQATLLMIDLDDFKQINDTMGHAVGDDALRDFARILQSSFRESDVVARIGGDEFCVLLTDSQYDDAWNCVERFRDALEVRNRLTERAHGLKFSAGVIQWDHAKHSCVAKLLLDADRLMYARKREKQLPKTIGAAVQSRHKPLPCQ